MKLLSLLISFGIFHSSFGQVGINTTSPESSSILDVSSNSKGLLIPRMTNTQMNAISSPAEGLQIYNTDAKSVYIYNGNDWISKEYKISGFVDDGVSIQLDNLKFQIPTTGNRSLQMATTSGTNNISGTSRAVYISSPASTGGSTGSVINYIRLTTSFGTSFANWDSNNFTLHGSSQTLDFYNESTGYSYKVMMIIGYGFNGNFISIARQ